MFNKLLGEVKGIFNTITLIELGISLLYILVGLIFFTNSQGSNVFVSIVTGVSLILSGISSIYSYFKRGDIVLFNNNLIFGILLIILGIVSMFLGRVLSIGLGIFFLISGLQRINYGVFLKKFNETSWLFTLTDGIFYMIIGIIAFLTNGDNVIEVAGICIMGYGILNMIDVILLRRRSKYFIA